MKKSQQKNVIVRSTTQCATCGHVYQQKKKEHEREKEKKKANKA